VTDPSPDPTDTSFDYSAAGSNGGDTDTSTFSLADGDSQDLMKGTSTDIKAGDYTVTETPDSQFTLSDIVCQDDSSTFDYGDGTTNDGDFADGDTSVTIHLVAGEHVTCVFTNTLKTGAIQISKVSSKSAATALAGAHFQICTNDGPYDPDDNPCDPAASGSDDLVSGTDGTVCIDGVGFGDYYVSETSPPTGYGVDDETVHKVTVNNSAQCSDEPYAGEAISFNDTPLTDVTVNVASEVSGGTNSAVQCVDSGSTDIGDSPQPAGANLGDTSTFGDPLTLTADALEPGTYTCTIVIDP
jgi:uncharacterized surface anchored protein